MMSRRLAPPTGSTAIVVVASPPTPADALFGFGVDGRLAVVGPEDNKEDKCPSPPPRCDAGGVSKEVGGEEVDKMELVEEVDEGDRDDGEEGFVLPSVSDAAVDVSTPAAAASAAAAGVNLHVAGA
jgi:hypothetical protein